MSKSRYTANAVTGVKRVNSYYPAGAPVFSRTFLKKVRTEQAKAKREKAERKP